MKTNTPRQLTIERLVFGGEGLARQEEATPLARETAGTAENGREYARGKAVFVPLVLPGELVEARIEEEHRSYARARMMRVLRPSAARQAPPCPYFGECGGCQWQHILPAEQFDFKQGILLETLCRLAGASNLPPVTPHPSPPWYYRNRARWRVRAEEPRLAYRRWHSHSALGVAQCRLLHPELERLTQLPWPPPPPELEELEAAVNDQGELQLHWLGRDLSPAALAWCEQASASAGCRAAAVTTRAGTQALHGEGWLIWRVGEYRYRISPGAFFQVNRFLLPELIEAMLSAAEGERALDLFSGVGLFALPLLDRFGWVSAVEADPVSASDLRWNAAHAASNQAKDAARLHVSAITAEEFLERASDARFDLVLVDPPRAGLGKRTLQGLLRLHPRRLHYLSCDPATLARDLKILLAAGYRLEQLHLFDLFPQTYHLETLVRLRRD